jgi:hypothetical protein
MTGMAELMWGASPRFKVAVPVVVDREGKVVPPPMEKSCVSITPSDGAVLILRSFSGLYRNIGL